MKSKTVQKQMLWMAPLFIALVVSSILGSAGKKPFTYVMPDELVELAENNGFVQIDDYYGQMPGFVDPPFVYGYMSKMARYMSVAFWCKKKQKSESDKSEYYLCFAVRDLNTPTLTIKNSINWSTLGGLSLFQDTSVSLEDFLYIDDLKQKGPKSVHLQDFGIRSYYDGNGEVFCKYKDRWLVLVQNDW